MVKATKENELNSLSDNVRALFSTNNIVESALDKQKLQFVKILSNQNILTILKDQEMMMTINTFFDNNLNISQASQNGFMHRNTLTYRLDKVKKLTGLNLKCFEDASIFSNLVIVYKKLF